MELLGYEVTTSNRTEKSHLLRTGTLVTLCGRDSNWSDWQHGDNAAPFIVATDCKKCMSIVNATYEALEK